MQHYSRCSTRGLAARRLAAPGTGHTCIVNAHTHAKQKVRGRWCLPRPPIPSQTRPRASPSLRRSHSLPSKSKQQSVTGRSRKGPKGPAGVRGPRRRGARGPAARQTAGQSAPTLPAAGPDPPGRHSPAAELPTSRDPRRRRALHRSTRDTPPARPRAHGRRRYLRRGGRSGPPQQRVGSGTRTWRAPRQPAAAAAAAKTRPPTPPPPCGGAAPGPAAEEARPSRTPESSESWACAEKRRREGQSVKTPKSTRPGAAPFRLRPLRGRSAPRPKQREVL